MTRRTDRIADAIQEVIAEILLREIKDPRIGMITLTGVRVSSDLRHARVYFSSMEGEEQRRQALSGLSSASGFIRHQLGRRLHLKVTPEVAFEFDPSLERAERLSRLLKGMSPEESK
jgi:ribosome-binding factor A